MGQKKLGKRIASWLLCIVMILTIVPMNTMQVQAVSYVTKFNITGINVPTHCGVSTDINNILLSAHPESGANYTINFKEDITLEKYIDGDYKTIRLGAYEESVYRNNGTLNSRVPNYQETFDTGSYRITFVLNPDTNRAYVWPFHDNVTGSINGKTTTSYVYNDTMLFVSYTFTIETHSYKSVNKSNEDYHWDTECVCGFVKKYNLHTYSDSPREHDEEQHWYTSTCTTCGYEEFKIGPHEFSWFTRKQPSATEEGERIYACSCGYIKEIEKIEKHEHKLIYLNIDDTYHREECVNCNYTSKSPHYYGNTIVDKLPTETEKGKIHSVCNCGKIDTGSYKEIDKWLLYLENFNIQINALGHPVCGDSLVIKDIMKDVWYPSGAHYKIDQEHEVTAVGKYDEKGNLYRVSGGYGTGWTGTDYKEVFEAGDYVFAFVLTQDNSDNKALNYMWKNFPLNISGTVNGQAPTSASYIPVYPYINDYSSIWVYYNFSVSHKSLSDFKSDDKNHWQVCSNCGEKTIEAHKFDAGVITKQPTISSTGIKTCKCTICGYTKTEIIAKLALKTQKITTAKIKTYKASALKKKSVKIKLKAKTDGKGKLTYKVTSTPKKMKKFIIVSKKGVVTLKKKVKKGSYKITITAAAKGNFKKTTKTITIKVK